MSQNDMNSRGMAVARIDQTSGEVLIPEQESEYAPNDIIPRGELVGLFDKYRDEMWPSESLSPHLAILEQLDVSDEERLWLAEMYGQESMTMKRFVDEHGGRKQDVFVYGMIIDEHGPFKPKGRDVIVEGYYLPKLLVRVDDTFMLVRTSSTLLGRIIFYTIKKYGWWLFLDKTGKIEPLRYRFYKGENDTLHMLHLYEGTDTVESRLLKRGKVSSK